MEIELLPIAEGWEVEVHYRPKLRVMEPEIALVYLISPDCEHLNITDVWPVLVPGLVGHLVMETVFKYNGA